MSILLWSAIILFIARLLVFSYLHVRFRSYSILKNTVSDYGTGEARQMYSIAGILSLVAYALVTIELLLQQAQPVWLTTVLAASVLGSIAILFFPTDLTGTKKKTSSGIIHWLLAILNFTLVFVFITNADTFSFLQPTTGIFVVMTWAVRIAFYSFLATLFVPKLRERFIGLTERLFLTTIPLWFIVLCSIILSKL